MVALLRKTSDFIRPFGLNLFQKSIPVTRTCTATRTCTVHTWSCRVTRRRTPRPPTPRPKIPPVSGETNKKELRRGARWTPVKSLRTGSIKSRQWGSKSPHHPSGQKPCQNLNVFLVLSSSRVRKGGTREDQSHYALNVKWSVRAVERSIPK